MFQLDSLDHVQSPCAFPSSRFCCGFAEHEVGVLGDFRGLDFERCVDGRYSMDEMMRPLAGEPSYKVADLLGKSNTPMFKTMEHSTCCSAAAMRDVLSDIDSKLSDEWLMPGSGAPTSRDMIPGHSAAGFFTLSGSLTHGDRSDNVKRWSLRQIVSLAMEQSDYASEILATIQVGTCVGNCHELATPLGKEATDLSEIYWTAWGVLELCEHMLGSASELMREQKHLAAVAWTLRANHDDKRQPVDAFTKVPARQQIAGKLERIALAHMHLIGDSVLGQLERRVEHLDVLMRGPHGSVYTNMQSNHAVTSRLKWTQSKNVAMASRKPLDHIYIYSAVSPDGDKALQNQWDHLPQFYQDLHHEGSGRLEIQLPPTEVLKKLLYAYDWNGKRFVRELQTFGALTALNAGQRASYPTLVHHVLPSGVKSVNVDAMGCLAPWRTVLWSSTPNALYGCVCFNNELVELLMEHLEIHEVVDYMFASRILYQAVNHNALWWRKKVYQANVANPKRFSVVTDVVKVDVISKFKIEGANFTYRQGSSGPFSSYWDAGVFRATLILYKPCARYCCRCLALTFRVSKVKPYNGRAVCDDCCAATLKSLDEKLGEVQVRIERLPGLLLLCEFPNLLQCNLVHEQIGSAPFRYHTNMIDLAALQLQHVVPRDATPVDVRFLLGGPHGSLLEPPVLPKCANFLSKPGFRTYKAKRETLHSGLQTERISSLYELYGGDDRMTTGRVFDFTKDQIMVSLKEPDTYPDWPREPAHETIPEDETPYVLNSPIRILLPDETEIGDKAGSPYGRRECQIIATKKIQGYDLCQACYSRCVGGGPFHGRTVQQILCLNDPESSDSD